MRESKLLGAWGEAQAAQYLQKKHYKLVAMGYSSRYGEIDLLVKNWRYLVFVEVKLRKNANFARALAMGIGSGLPLEDAVEQAGKLLADIPAAASRCQCCVRLLHSGAQLSDAMGQSGFLGSAESRMLALGLRQGNGDKVMADLADRLMEQADEALENAVAKIEPAMVLLASVLVGAILLTVMLPLMNIMAAIG